MGGPFVGLYFQDANYGHCYNARSTISDLCSANIRRQLVGSLFYEESWDDNPIFSPIVLPKQGLLHPSQTIFPDGVDNATQDQHEALASEMAVRNVARDEVAQRAEYSKASMRITV